MIITPEQAALQAQGQLDALRDFVQQAARDGQRIDTVERGLMRQVLAFSTLAIRLRLRAPERSPQRSIAAIRSRRLSPPTCR